MGSPCLPLFLHGLIALLCVPTLELQPEEIRGQGSEELRAKRKMFLTGICKLRSSSTVLFRQLNILQSLYSQ